MVEDNRKDVQLSLGAFEKGNVANEIVVAAGGEEAINYLFTRALTRIAIERSCGE